MAMRILSDEVSIINQAEIYLHLYLLIYLIILLFLFIFYFFYSEANLATH